MTATTTTPERVPDLPAPSSSPARAHEPVERSSLRSLWQDTVVYTGRNLQHIRQIPEKLLDVTLQPLMFVLLFTYVFGGAMKGVDNYQEYLIGGILLQSLAFGMTGPATAIATDLTEGVVDRFRSLPSNKAAYLLGHYGAELLGMMLSVAVLLGAGLIVGWRVHTDPLHVLGALLLLFTFASAMIWVGTWIGLLVRTPDAVMGVGFTVVFPLTFLSNAFVPIGTLPGPLLWFASWNPISAMVAAVRELFGNPGAPLTNPTWPLENPVAASAIYCVAILAVAVPMALRRYRKRTAD